MYVISFNSSIVRVSISDQQLSINQILIISDHKLKLIIKELNVHYATCIPLGSTDKLKPMMKVSFFSKSYSFNIHESHIGVALDPNLNTLAGKATSNKFLYNVSCTPSNIPSIVETSGEIKIRETGIKAIDFFGLFIEGAKNGIMGGAGVGKTTLLMEVIQNLKLKEENQYTVFSGIGERIREGHELYQDLIDANLIKKDEPHKSNILVIYGNMDQPASIRYLSGIVAANIANTLVRNNHNVLVVIDNIIRFAQSGNEIATCMNKELSEIGYQPSLDIEMSTLQELMYIKINNIGITSIQAIYVPADDNSDLSVITVEKHIRSKIVLSRELASRGIYPPVDVMASDSQAQNKNIMGDIHYNILKKVKTILSKYESLEQIIKIVGLDNISDENKIIVHRAKLINAFCTQPFKVSSKYTGIDGEYVSMADTIDGFSKIVNGELDNIHPREITMIGKIRLNK